tara:strand:+ start:4159 stop:5016 length:858 start_codon:yes stop_codon:yes gene_type:complete
MKGVILAGGTGSRLYPITKTVNKHLLPVYDKPLIYYPLSNLLLTGCKEILIISNPEYLNDLESLLGNGDNFGVKLYYQKQLKPEGIPSALSLAKNFSNKEDIWVSLGDNFIFGSRLQEIYEEVNQSSKATIFIKHVGNIKGFGSAYIKEKKIVNLKEKPKSSLPGWAVTGLYKFPNSVFDYIPQIKPSKRNETEIIDLLSIYLKSDNLDYKIFGRGVTWVDCGTVDDLKLADNYVNNYQKINNTLICSPEEIAFNLKLISESDFLKNINNFKNSDYYQNLKNTIE